MSRATPFLMFQQGKAEAALDFYVAAVTGSRIVSIERATARRHGAARLRRDRRPAGDGPRRPCHARRKFTPPFSFFLDGSGEAEIGRPFVAPSEGGKVPMPLDAYGLSGRFGRTSDRFGLSWQINLP